MDNTKEEEDSPTLIMRKDKKIHHTMKSHTDSEKEVKREEKLLPNDLTSSVS
jgi:hypothetical protein